MRKEEVWGGRDKEIKKEKVEKGRGEMWIEDEKKWENEWSVMKGERKK